VHEHILTAIVTDDEAEALLSVEELYDALAFANDLSRHSAPTATAAATETAAATKAAATAAAEAVATAEAAATAAAEAVTAISAATAAELVAATISAEIFVPEAVALIPATALAAAPTIKTHAVLVFQYRPTPSRLPAGRCTRVLNFRQSQITKFES
jgi:hypothetical protein